MNAVALRGALPGQWLQQKIPRSFYPRPQLQRPHRNMPRKAKRRNAVERAALSSPHRHQSHAPATPIVVPHLVVHAQEKWTRKEKQGSAGDSLLTLPSPRTLSSFSRTVLMPSRTRYWSSGASGFENTTTRHRKTGRKRTIGAKRMENGLFFP